MDSITYDFVNKCLCKYSNSSCHKTIDYKLGFYQWFCVYKDDFIMVDDLVFYDKNSIITHFIRNNKIESKILEGFDDNNIYEYIYTMNNEQLILYKIVPFSCDWFMNSYCDNIEMTDEEESENDSEEMFDEEEYENESEEDSEDEPKEDIISLNTKIYLMFGLMCIIYIRLC